VVIIRFIVIDGLDGSGKDTQARMLQEYLEKKGEKVVLRAHPSRDSRLGRISRKALTKKGSLMRIIATLFFGFDVVRSVHLYCKGGGTVIFVRYIMASAYLPKPIIKPVYWLVSRWLPTSDEMFFLDVAPAEALRRVKARGEQEEMFETLPKMEKVRGRALMIADRWAVIDGNGPVEEVFSKIVCRLRR